MDNIIAKALRLSAGDAALSKLARLSRLPQVHACIKPKTRLRRPNKLSASLGSYHTRFVSWLHQFYVTTWLDITLNICCQAARVTVWQSAFSMNAIAK